MSAQGLGSPLIESPTVAGTLGAITMCQGALIEGDGAAAFGAASGAIVTMVGECKGNGEGQSKGGGKDNGVVVARGGDDDTLIMIQSLQAEVAAVKNVNIQFSNSILELKDDNERLLGALSSAEKEAEALELRVEAYKYFDSLEVENQLSVLSNWLRGLGVEAPNAILFARVLWESGVVDVSVLRELDDALAEEVLLAAGLTEAETHAAMEALE
jgi:hypothetical protein